MINDVREDIYIYEKWVIDPKYFDWLNTKNGKTLSEYKSLKENGTLNSCLTYLYYEMPKPFLNGAFYFLYRESR